MIIKMSNETIDEKIENLDECEFDTIFAKYVVSKIKTKYKEETKDNCFKYEYLLENIIDLKKGMMYDIIYPYDVDDIYSTFNSTIDVEYNKLTEEEVLKLNDEFCFMDEKELRLTGAYKRVIIEVYNQLGI